MLAGPARTKAISLYVVAFGVIGSLASVLIQYLNQTFSAKRRTDPIGTGLAAAGLFLLLFGINNAGARGFTSPDVIVPALVGIAVLGVLVFYSSRIAQPVLQVKLFKSTVFAFGLLLGVMLNISYSASAYQANLLMQAVVKVPPVLAAIYLLPLASAATCWRPRCPHACRGAAPPACCSSLGRRSWWQAPSCSALCRPPRSTT